MTCKKCGTAVEDGKKFCPTCGNPMAAPEAAAPAPEPTPAPAPEPTPAPANLAMFGLDMPDRLASSSCVICSSRRQRNPQCSGKSV